MNVAEMNLVAGNYDIQVKRVPGQGLYLIDLKSDRYQHMCDEADVKHVNKEKLVQEIRRFTSYIHKRTSF